MRSYTGGLAMASNAPVPYFPSAPATYNQDYMSQIVRSFSLFIQQTNNPGEAVYATLRLIRVPTFANNAAAVAGNLSVGDLYQTAAGGLRIVV